MWRSWLARRSVLVAQDQTASFLWRADIAHAVETGVGDMDRPVKARRAIARDEFGRACRALDIDIGRDLTKQPAWDQNTSSAIALGERRRQAQPELPVLIAVRNNDREITGEQT